MDSGFNWFNLGAVLLFLLWGAFCFWVGRRPDQARVVRDAALAKAHDLGEQAVSKVNELMSHMQPGALPLESYADAADMAMAIGASGYAGQVMLDGKIIKSGTSPGVRYVTTTNGVNKVV